MTEKKQSPHILQSSPSWETLEVAVNMSVNSTVAVVSTVLRLSCMGTIRELSLHKSCHTIVFFAKYKRGRKRRPSTVIDAAVNIASCDIAWTSSLGYIGFWVPFLVKLF